MAALDYELKLRKMFPPYPGICEEYMKQLVLDMRDGLLTVADNRLLYADGRDMVYRPEEDSCKWYRTHANGRLLYMGPAINGAVSALLEAEKDFPTVDKLVPMVRSTKFITGVGWLLAHGFEARGDSCVSCVHASLARFVEIPHRNGCFQFTVRMHGWYGDRVNWRYPEWEAYIEENWCSDVKTAIEHTGIERGKGSTPRKALTALQPTLVSLTRLMRKYN